MEKLDLSYTNTTDDNKRQIFGKDECTVCDLFVNSVSIFIIVRSNLKCLVRIDYFLV